MHVDISLFGGMWLPVATLVDLCGSLQLKYADISKSAGESMNIVFFLPSSQSYRMILSYLNLTGSFKRDKQCSGEKTFHHKKY